MSAAVRAARVALAGLGARARRRCAARRGRGVFRIRLHRGRRGRVLERVRDAVQFHRRRLPDLHPRGDRQHSRVLLARPDPRRGRRGHGADARARFPADRPRGAAGGARLPAAVRALRDLRRAGRGAVLPGRRPPARVRACRAGLRPTQAPRPRLRAMRPSDRNRACRAGGLRCSRRARTRPDSRRRGPLARRSPSRR